VNQEHILATLGGYDPLMLPRGEAQASAVLVPLREMENGDGVEVILTLRVTHPKDPHSGQVSFPGGRREAGDDDRVHTALREAHEELGIPPERVRVVGRLDEMLTVTGYHVAPIVGTVPRDVELIPSADEVARVFTVPVDELLREERWEHRVHSWRGSEVLVWHFPHDGEDVWGATARMLRDMVELLRTV
jgi:8-oxo-dGTP pyrophosphatase MutT (NUDIX family)